MLKKTLNKYLKIVLLMTAVVGLGVICSPAMKKVTEPLSFFWEPKWISYSPQNAEFTAHFPEAPKVESKQLEVTKYNRTLSYQHLTAEDNEVIYSVSYLNFPKKWRILGPKTLLKKCLEILISTENPDHELIDKKVVQHAQHPAVDFQLKQLDQEIRGRLILVGTTLYRVTVTYPSTKADSFSPEQFLHSFEIGMPQTT